MYGNDQTPLVSQSSDNQEVAGAPATPPTPAPPAGPSQFDIDQQILNVRSERYFERGNDFITSYAPFGPLGAIDKYRGQQIQLRRIRRAKKHLRANPSGVPIDDANAWDDLALQETATRNQLIRRGSQLLGATPIPPLFEGRANKASLQLAKNQREDAERKYAADPSRENWLLLRSARQGVIEREQWFDANKYDVFGFGSNLGDLGPIKRWQASETALDNAERAHRELRVKYAADPSEDNWWELRLSNIRLRALEADIDANKGETLWFVGTNPSLTNMFLGQFLNAISFDDEEELWQQYHRLSLQNLLRKRARAAGTVPNPVQAQLLALDNYGPVAVPAG